jgi:FdhD protein
MNQETIMFKRSVNITRITKQKQERLRDTVLIESPVDLIINSESLVNIICLPKDLEELAAGFLFSIGLINSMEDIKEIKINEIENKIFVNLYNQTKFSTKALEINPVSRVIDTTCGISSPWREFIKTTLDQSHKSKLIEENIKINSTQISSSIKQIHREMTLYRETGGCHGAAIFDFKGNLLGIKEDIGRHNAIDKVIGELLIKEINFDRVFLTSSGRLTGDSVLKAIRARIPIVASVSAAIESGIRLAFAYGITLIGFVRGSRMNIYTYPERIAP